jgi:hypothetical protein
MNVKSRVEGLESSSPELIGVDPKSLTLGARFVEEGL